LQSGWTVVVTVTSICTDVVSFRMMGCKEVRAGLS
jgi:hypothetical protein